jgi:soluble lytic murein transglycosylase-like protein
MEINKINRAYYAGQTGTANTARKNCDFPGTLQDVGSNDYDYDRIFETASEIYGVPAGLLKAVAETESNMNPCAISPSGAQGIMQLMPSTAKHLGVSDLFNPEQNIMGGARYLQQLLYKFNSDISLALAAYNAGPNTVSRYGGIPPYEETSNFVGRVLSKYEGSGPKDSVSSVNEMTIGSIRLLQQLNTSLAETSDHDNGGGS